MRIRVRYQKKGELIYTSALDLQKIWERALRRARLAVKYTEGFHPQPKMQLAVPLPVGFIGMDEIIDIWLETPVSLTVLQDRLLPSLPGGITINSILEVPIQEKALNGKTESAEYIALINNDIVDSLRIAELINELLRKKNILRIKNKKQYDLRSLVISIDMNDSAQTGIILIKMHLSANPGAFGRPDEVLRELEINPSECEITRTKVYFRKQ